MAKDQKPADANAVKPEIDTRPGLFRRGLGHVPTWVIALGLLLPILVLEQFDLLSKIKCLFDNSWGFLILAGIALFIPGALKRWNWRGILLMAVLGAASAVIGRVLSRTTIVAHSNVLTVLIAALFLLLLGLGEMFLQHKRNWKNLAWLVSGVIAVIAIHFLVQDYLWATGWMVSLPNRYGSTGSQAFVDVIKLPLLAVLTWLTIPVCLRIAASGSRAKRLALGGTFTGAVAVYVVFAHILWYPLMAKSLTGDGPFERAAAVRSLAWRGRDSDFERIWQTLEEADWTKPYAWAEESPSYIGDWRQIAIAHLAKRDSADTAKKLSRLLRNRPRKKLAYEAAPLFAKHKRYETVPILMRYALSERDYRCITALEQMNLPRSALPIMRSRIVWEIRFNGKPLTRFSKETCERLKPLLGSDPGNKVDAWLQLYDKVIADRPTPLPKPIRQKTDHVITSMLLYYVYENDGAQISFDLGRQKGWSSEQVRKMIRSIRKPDWDVITTEELEREIKAYGKRYDAVLDKHFPPQTQPADTAPAN